MQSSSVGGLLARMTNGQCPLDVTWPITSLPILSVQASSNRRTVVWTPVLS